VKLSRTGVITLAATLPLAALALLIAPFMAQAASAPLPSPSCTITTADLATVTAARTQGLLAELAARKALLVKTITCAKKDAQTVQTTLNALSVGNNATTLQSQLSGKLDDAINFYNIELDKVNNAGIAGTEEIASEVLTWRASNYDPLAAQVANFILWSGNQAIFTTGVARLQSIGSIVAFVEQAAPQNELQGDLADAQALMQTALEENTQATNAFIQSLPPDQTLLLIQQSLQSLSDAYAKFFSISTVLQTLLPAKSE
jgi:hypothetical protein